MEILAVAGLRIVCTQRHDQAMLRMIDQIEARLCMTVSAKLTDVGVDFAAAPAVLRAARVCVADGTLGVVSRSVGTAKGSQPDPGLRPP